MLLINKTVVSFLYEISMASLIIYSLIVKLPEDQDRILSWFVWGLFFIDYMVRLILSKDKWTYVKKHPLELMAILPLDQLFRTLRLVRVIRLLRLIVIFRRKNSFFEVLTNRFKVDRILVVIIALLFFSSLLIYRLEPSFDSLEDALWWSVVTTTTVGYGDLYPVTTTGRLIASFLMFVGIGLIGVVTGMVASFFAKGEDLPKELKYVKERIENYSQLTDDDIDLMIGELESYKESNDDFLEGEK